MAGRRKLGVNNLKQFKEVNKIGRSVFCMYGLVKRNKEGNGWTKLGYVLCGRVCIDFFLKCERRGVRIGHVNLEKWEGKKGGSFSVIT